MALADPATDMELDPAEVVSEPRVAESPFAAPPIGEVAVEPFESWLDVNRWNARQEVHLRRRLAHAPTALPQISILMPVFNTPVVWLRRAIESVEMQLYGGWQLCISDNCSTDIETKQFLKSLIGDPRILVKFLPENVHIPRNTNSAAGLATGDFLVLLDSDDELTVDSLAEVALYIADNPETDLLYSDTDKIDEHGWRYDPAFKPDWSPEMLLSFMYAGQVLAVRRELFEALGGLRPGFEGSQDHDFALRAGERARHVGHIPKILYHWRSVPGSTARSGKEKPYAVVAGRKAVQEALERRGSRGVAVQPEWAKQGGNSLFVHEFPDEGPSVTVIMPTGGDVALLKTCVTGLLEETRYPIFELIILYNTSMRPEAFPYFEILSNDPRVQIIDSKGRFNFSRICNLGVAAARGEYLLLLNDDIVVTEPHWLGNMMGYAQLEGVGAVGAQLRFPDGRIQHAGVVHGFAGLSGHAFKLLPPGQNGYMSMVEVPRNYGAVTAACMLTRRSLYLEIGGLDEDHLGVAYNDPDYCYRLLQRGYRIVYTPSAVLTHLEGATRGKVDDPREVAAFRERYCNWIDPYYNPNLSLDDEQFHIQPRCVVLGERRDMRAAVFTHNLNWEGAPTLQCQTVSELRRRGILRPVVLSPMDGPLRSEYEAAGCQVIVAPLPVVPWEPQARYQDGVATLVGRLRALDVELVYANTVETHYAVDAARELGLPAIWNIHESEDWRHRFENWSPEVRSRLYRNFAYPYRVVFGAHATRRCYADLETRHNFAVIHNGLALGPIAAGIRLYTRESARRQNAISDTDVVFLVLGTVCERKGQRELIEAATRLGREDWQRMRIFIVGDRPGPYSEDLHAFVSALPELARQRVHIVAETGDTALFYRSADVFVCTSRIESYPRVIMEAMAYALPIITTPVFGIAEQVVEGVNSLLYDPGDPAALSALMNSLLEDTVLRERMGAASSDVLHTLTSFEQTCQQYTTIFAEAALSSVPDLA
jgi:GT2 family glycosyltransferase/glycosyltransferase involved in cell wall biosynthesis